VKWIRTKYTEPTNTATGKAYQFLWAVRDDGSLFQAQREISKLNDTSPKAMRVLLDEMLNMPLSRPSPLVAPNAYQGQPGWIDEGC
jgi:hypothetical protein